MAKSRSRAASKKHNVQGGTAVASLMGGVEPIAIGALLAAAVATGTISANALWWQEGRHPAPLLPGWSVAGVDLVPQGADRGPPALAPRDDRVLIAELQRELATRNHYQGAVDGFFGPATADAIRAYQAAEGLIVNGAPSAALLSHMLGFAAPMIEDASASMEALGSGVAGIDRDTMLALQGALAEHGYGPLGVDGLFGTQTDAAIRRFQTDQQLSVDGKPTPEVFERVVEIGALDGAY